jgi:hypothetical protein
MGVGLFLLLKIMALALLLSNIRPERSLHRIVQKSPKGIIMGIFEILLLSFLGGLVAGLWWVDP